MLAILTEAVVVLNYLPCLVLRIAGAESTNKEDGLGSLVLSGPGICLCLVQALVMPRQDFRAENLKRMKYTTTITTVISVASDSVNPVNTRAKI